MEVRASQQKRARVKIKLFFLECLVLIVGEGREGVWVERSLSSQEPGPEREWEGKGGEVPGEGWVALQLPWNLEVQRGHLGRTWAQRPLGCSSWGCSQVSLASHSSSVGTAVLSGRPWRPHPWLSGP